METTSVPKPSYSITPLPGYILCKPHLEDRAVFKSVREADGMDQRSLVIAVGGNIVDSAGILRETNIKEGNIIIHAQTNKDFDYEFNKYRWVHFSEVHGMLQILNTK